MARNVSEEKALGQRLASARRKAGLTQQELCQKAGLSYSTLAKIERGAIRSPSVFTVAAIAQTTATPLDKLLGIKTGESSVDKKTSKNGVNFVYFDVDGVIIPNYMQIFAKIAQSSGASVDQIENAYWRHNDAVCRSDITIDEFNKRIAKELGLAGFDWNKYYLDNAETAPAVEELLNWVAANFEIGLLTNHNPDLTEQMFERGLIPRLNFKAIIDSSKVGAVKPEPEIYKIAQGKAGVPAGEIMFIDDSRPNLTVADKLGWQVLWFDAYDPAGSIERIRESLSF